MTASPPPGPQGCPSRFGGHGHQCLLKPGHAGKHKGPDALVWGGRYSAADLRGTPAGVQGGPERSGGPAQTGRA